MRTPTICLMLLVVLGCAEEENRAPELQPVNDDEFTVNQSDTVDLYAKDDDGDDLTWTFTMDPPPFTQTSGVAGKPALVKYSSTHAQFTWTPGIADAGGQPYLDYSITIQVSDSRGGQDQATFLLRVVDDGGVVGTALRFTEPAGAGMAVDLSQTTCVNGLTVKVKGDQISEDQVRVELAAPIPEGAVLTGMGKTRTLNWCPSEAQLDQSLTHTLTFRASHSGADAPVEKRFMVRFKRGPTAGCAGEAPQIIHAPPAPFSGPLNYVLTAQVTDDIGFKSPPVLVYTTTEPPSVGTPDTSSWSLVEFGDKSGDTYRASIPNLGLAEGVTGRIWYQIIATDNDDTQGTRCDHTVESPVYSFEVEGGVGDGQTYGYCEPCVADEQCGGADDLCVDLRGQSFCAVSCVTRSCLADQQCLVVEGTGGRTVAQCVPADLNCGQLCVDDLYEAERNDTVETATPITAGVYQVLTICAGDQDYFTVPVQAGQRLAARIEFTNASGDLDLGMALPGDETFAYQSLNGDTDYEAVQEPCVPQSGDALIGVIPYDAAENQYKLTVELSAGNCADACVPDEFERAGNNDMNNFTPLDELPFEAEGLTLCRGDSDFYGFDAEAGELIQAAIVFSHVEGNLDLRVYRGTGELLGESAGFRDTEVVEVEVPVSDIYVVEVVGASAAMANQYGIVIQRAQILSCQSTLECPAGSYCEGGRCLEDFCGAGYDNCGGPQVCAPTMAGLDPESQGGACLALCQTDAECRQALGYRCKHFEDFSMACGQQGAALVGDRCTSYWDCAGAMACFSTPGGYCAMGGCDDDLPCPDGTVCGALGGLPACLKRCQGDGDCRVAEGYSCRDQGAGVKACAR